MKEKNEVEKEKSKWSGRKEIKKQKKDKLSKKFKKGKGK